MSNIQLIFLCITILVSAVIIRQGILIKKIDDAFDEVSDEGLDNKIKDKKQQLAQIISIKDNIDNITKQDEN